MLKVLSNILCDLDPTVKVIGQKAGICDGVPSTSALVIYVLGSYSDCVLHMLLLRTRICHYSIPVAFGSDFVLI